VAIGIAQHLNAIVVWSFLFFGLSFVLFGMVRATGAVLPPLIILAVALWFVRVPFAWLLHERFGADAVWWSFPLGSLVAVLLAVAYYRWGDWRHASMLGGDAQQAASTGLDVPTVVVLAPASGASDSRG
jgi:Na+-driven multidrug efflux pump